MRASALSAFLAAVSSFLGEGSRNGNGEGGGWCQRHKYISVAERYGKSSFSLERAFSLGWVLGPFRGVESLGGVDTPFPIESSVVLGRQAGTGTPGPAHCGSLSLFTSQKHLWSVAIGGLRQQLQNVTGHRHHPRDLV